MLKAMLTTFTGVAEEPIASDTIPKKACRCHTNLDASFGSMSVRYLLAVLGAALILLGIGYGGWYLLLVWLGCDFLALAIAYVKGGHGLFGKRSDGTLPWWSWLVFGPLLVGSYAFWHARRFTSGKPAFTKVTEQLIVGRRLLPSEVDGQFDNYIDLTAEFAEPPTIRRLPGYRSFPILDHAAPSPDVLRTEILRLGPGRTLVHCAEGHGRAPLFALAGQFRASHGAHDRP